MEAWRSNYHGVQTRFKKTNFILYGSVDDIWLDTKNNSLILADYKSQANENKVNQETYWDGDFKSGYQRQLDFYYYLLKQQNLKERFLMMLIFLWLMQEVWRIHLIINLCLSQRLYTQQ